MGSVRTYWISEARDCTRRKIFIESWEEMKSILRDKYLPEYYRQRLLDEKLDQILKLTQDCNFTLKRIELQSESRHVDNLMAEDDIFVSPEVTSPPIPTDVHTHDSDTNDVKCESGVESIMTTLSYPLSSQHL